MRRRALLVLGVLALCWVGCAAAPPRAATPATDPAPAAAPVIAITARKWSFTPATIALRLGQPVILEVASVDGHHGFEVPDLGFHADLRPGAPVHLALTPRRAGTFTFHCDVFCGDGHEDMTGELVVTP